MNNKTNINKGEDKGAHSFEWGVITTQNPTAFARNLVENGIDVTVIKEHLIKDYSVSQKMANLVYQTIKSQKTIIRNEKLINLQINLPFWDCDMHSDCQTKQTEQKNKIPAYLKALKEEINAVKEIVYTGSYIVRSIYIKGDMPNLLSAEEMDELLSEISYPVSEFTAECSTITEEKLLILKKHGVNRLCIKPKTFVVKTLKKLGAKHTNRQVFETYMLALQHNFFVSVKLVAGLEGETFFNFKKTILTLIELSPHNVMIDAIQSSQHKAIKSEDTLRKMIDFSSKTLLKSGYKPYYLYLKNGLENIGYATGGKVSLFDIDFVEETLSLIGCGVCAISRTAELNDKKPQKTLNDKSMDDYIKNVQKIIKNKKKLF